MILVVGGEGSGKRTFAEGLGYAPTEMADGVLDGRPVIFHVETMVMKDISMADVLLDALLKKEVVICNEVGSGVIPAEREKCLAREAAGRLCVLLAKQAEAVVRMACGIPTVIKGELPCKS